MKMEDTFGITKLESEYFVTANGCPVGKPLDHEDAKRVRNWLIEAWPEINPQVSMKSTVDWVDSSIDFLMKCQVDDRLAAVPLLFAKVVIDGMTAAGEMSKEAKVKAIEELGKHLIYAMGKFVSDNRARWFSKPVA